MTIKTKKDIEILREGGRRHAEILEVIASQVLPGISTEELNRLANDLILEKGDVPAFLNYRPEGARRPYPATLCVSLNEEIVHGIPNENPKILKDGDIVSIDLGLKHKGLFTDMAITLGVGKIDDSGEKLMEATEEALRVGVGAVRDGVTTGDIGFAIATYIKTTPFSVVEDLAGHGVGYKVHEDPYVPNYGKRGEGEVLREGMVIAIEPMLSEGKGKIILDRDGYTYKTKDGSRSAHFEHTVLVTKEGAEILTQI